MQLSEVGVMLVDEWACRTESSHIGVLLVPIAMLAVYVLLQGIVTGGVCTMMYLNNRQDIHSVKYAEFLAVKRLLWAGSILSHMLLLFRVFADYTGSSLFWVFFFMIALAYISVFWLGFNSVATAVVAVPTESLRPGDE